MRFEGRTAVVTGAGSGLGRATARRLAAEGAAVACLDIAEGAVKETVDSIDGSQSGGRAIAVACDVTDEASVAAAVERTATELGRPSVVCNIAGIGRFHHSHELSLAEWSQILAVNLTGTFLVCRATLPHLLDGGGVIVNVASNAGLMGQPYSAAYNASKHGVVGLTRGLAVEYLRRGVRVNAVAPGGIDTPLVTKFEPPEGASFKDLARIMSPLGMAQPEEIAGTIAYVASEEARYMTGSIVSIDGGLTA
jgi:NAD(P)-dependent dehydrogenase (short-subunit alcohol dehydrogenase family)